MWIALLSILALLKYNNHGYTQILRICRSESGLFPSNIGGIKVIKRNIMRIRMGDREKES